MKRSMMQAYAKGSAEAVETYQRAFDAKLVSEYRNEDGSYYHSELDVYGQIVAVSEAAAMDYTLSEGYVAGNTMQFCLHFGAEEMDKVQKAYEVLRAGAQVFFPLGPCEFSSGMADLVDRFGVRWCLFAD